MGPIASSDAPTGKNKQTNKNKKLYGSTTLLPVLALARSYVWLPLGVDARAVKFWPYCWGGQFEPGLKRIVCRSPNIFVRLKRLRPSVSACPFQIQNVIYISNGWTASASQWTPAVWTEVKERPGVPRDGNSRVAEGLNTSIFPLL